MTDTTIAAGPAAIRIPTRLAYGFATLGTGSFLVVPQLFLLFFMTDHLNIPPVWASFTLLLPKLWEFLTDPYIGLRSDRSRSSWGRRHPFMLAGAILLSLGIALVFNVPQFDSPEMRWLYVTATFVLATTGYALFSVPYTALLGEMTADRHERTRLVALRMGFLGASLLIAAVGWPEVLKALGGSTAAYGVVGWGVGALCLAAMLVTVFGTRRIPLIEGPVDATSLVDQLRLVLRERAFVLLALAYGLQMLAQSANTAMLAYVGKYWSPLGADFLALYFGVMTLVSILAMVAWAAVARYLSKRICFVLGGLIGAAGFLISAAGLFQPLWVLIVGAALAGIGFSAGQVFGFSLLPDVIDGNRRRTGVNRDGAFTGVWVGWEKIGLALGAMFAGLALGWTGFVASSSQAVEQPAAALSSIIWLFGIVPGILMALSVLPLLMRSLREA